MCISLVGNLKLQQHQYEEAHIQLITMRYITVVHTRCGACQCGTKSITINLILMLFLYHFFTYNELVTSQDHPHHTTNPINTTIMVVEPPIPPVA